MNTISVLFYIVIFMAVISAYNYRQSVKYFIILFLVAFSGYYQVAAEEMGDTSPGNNLSFPVVFPETQKALRGTPNIEPVLNGEWRYHWGEDEDGNPLTCVPDPDNDSYCDNGVYGTVSSKPGGNRRAYLQQDLNNVWQAETIIPGGRVTVDEIDIGDNLESMSNWYLNSMVRAEFVLLENLPKGAKNYEMLHVSGWGQDEMWGLSEPERGKPESLSSTQATIYSNCARFTMQKLLVPKDDSRLSHLFWVEPAKSDEVVEGGWIGAGLVDSPIFTGAVRDGGDGPGYYSAEINVKGKVIYGYTWNVRDLNQGEGAYRLTFSLDESCSELMTSISPETTSIYYPEEEEEVTTSSESDDTFSGNKAVIGDNYVYIDVSILSERSTGKDGNSGKGESAGKGGGNGKNGSTVKNGNAGNVTNKVNIVQSGNIDKSESVAKSESKKK